MCAKAVGQDCGGWRGFHAGRTCADGLFCEYSPLDTQNDFNSGICKRENPKDNCCDRIVVKETLEVYTLNLTSGRRALDICLDGCVYRKDGDVSGKLFCFKDGDLNIECP